MEAVVACRIVSENRDIKYGLRCECRRLQRDRWKEGVKLCTVQTELTVVAAIVRIILMRVCHIERLSGQQNNQEQIMQSPPSSPHTIFPGALFRHCHFSAGLFRRFATLRTMSVYLFTRAGFVERGNSNELIRPLEKRPFLTGHPFYAYGLHTSSRVKRMQLCCNFCRCVLVCRDQRLQRGHCPCNDTSAC